ncbi:MAG: DUF4387 domain-containing protein [Bacillota bacterium]|nr:DUF4387 domain-containing protein [Bacillota bacterium]
MKLKDLASVIRSKNASPFITTLDMFFEDESNYDRVKSSGVISTETVARVYKIPEASVVGVWFVDACRGIKVSFLKPRAADDVVSGDLYGAQQNAPLLELEVT